MQGPAGRSSVDSKKSASDTIIPLQSHRIRCTLRIVATTLLSSAAVAIAIAKQNGTLRIVEGVNRFGAQYWAIEDDRGLIEVAMSAEEADRIVAAA